ncbi:unnamed protein product [Sphagnum troendelagicum]|uniref:Protein XRI1 n=1 Tax=Sphagnum troendelagicum TaxID=128251 RepID=A0ABP0TIC5_9BRYO
MTPWEDLTTQSEELDAAARFLFPVTMQDDATIARRDCGLLHQSLHGNIEVQETFVSNNILETNVPPLKRRRLLFNEDLTANAAAHYEPSLGHFKGGQDDEFLSLNPSSFYSDADDIVDDASCSSSGNQKTPSAESWMDACIAETDGSNGHIKAGGPYCEFSVPQNSRKLSPTPQSTRSCYEEWNLQVPGTPFSSQPSTPGSNASTGRNLKITIPSAYPFTLLKPSDVDGAMTLSDINQLILTPRMSDAGHFYRGSDLRHSKSSNLGVSLSGKSIVTCTRVCTEGNGTITILRTKD